MELIKESVKAGEVVYSDSFETMTEGDLIVPDVKPDILKVLQVDANSCISSKEITDGRLSVSGRIDFSILYIPDGGDAQIQCMRTSLDFSHKLDKSSINEDCYAVIDSDVTRAEFHVINSRKLSLKAITSIDCEIISAREISFLTGIEEENAQIQTEPVTVNAFMGARDEDFMIKEMIEIPAGKASIGEILNIAYKISDKELKVITEKVVVKGILNVCVLYIDTGGSIEYTEAEIPFTEVFDFPNVYEEMSCSLNFRICDCYFDIAEDSDGDRRLINLELLVCAEMKAGSSMQLDVISDCFCPGYATKLEYEKTTLNETVCSPSVRNAIRDVAVIDSGLPQISSVYNVVTKSYITKSHTEENKLSVEGKIEAYILYITDDTQTPVYSVKKEIPFSVSLDSPGASAGMACRIEAEVSHTSYHLNVASEVELRCILNISAEVSKSRTVTLISGAETETIPRDKKKGIVIYFVQPQDSLWGIAKYYCVSVEDILKFNQLTDKDKISVGQRLVIPPSGSCA